MLVNKGNIFSTNPGGIISMDEGSLPAQSTGIFHIDVGNKKQGRSLFGNKGNIFHNRFQLIPKWEIDYTRGIVPIAGVDDLGVGNFVLDRNPDEYYYNGAAVINAVDNTPRLNSATGYHGEYEFGNIALQSRNFDVAPWTVIGTPTFVTDQTGVEGSANKAYTFGDDDAGSIEGIYQQFQIAADGDSYTFSIYIKKTVAAASFPGIGLYWGTSATVAYITVDTDNGSIVDYTGGGPAESGIEDAGDFWFVWVSDKNAGADIIIDVRIYPAVNADASDTWANITTGTCVIDMAQVVASCFPMSRTIDNDGVVIGANLVVDGTFDVVTDDAGELSAGSLTIGRCYKISARVAEDFMADGSPNNVVGTYFNCTATNVTLDANNRVFPVTFDHWVAGSTAVSPQAVAGVLTGKVNWDGSQGGIVKLSQPGILTVGKMYRTKMTFTLVPGPSSISIYAGDNNGSYRTVAGTYYEYLVCEGTTELANFVNANFKGTVDDIECVEYGKTGVSESAILQHNTPPLLFNTEGTAIIRWVCGANEADLIGSFAVISLRAAWANAFLHWDWTTKKIRTSDGTNIAAFTLTLVKGVAYKTVITWRTGANGLTINNDEGLGMGVAVTNTFDGAFTTTGDKIYSIYRPESPVSIKSIKIWDRVLSTEEIVLDGGP